MRTINNTYSEEINISEIFKILRKRLKFIVIITLLFSLTSGIISFYVITPKYMTHSSLFVGKDKGSIGESINEIDTYVTLISTYTEIIRTKPVISEALNKKNVDISPEKVLANLSVTSREKTQIMDITYVDEDPDRAYKVINALTNEFLVKSKEMMSNANLQILEPAEEVYAPFSPNKGRNIMIATILGLMISVGVAFLLEFLNNTYMSEEDIKNDLDIPVLGEISLMKQSSYKQNKKNFERKERITKKKFKKENEQKETEYAYSRKTT